MELRHIKGYFVSDVNKGPFIYGQRVCYRYFVKM